MTGSIGLGRPLGIPLRLHYSWFLVLVLFTYSLAMFLGELRPFWSSAERWGVALAASLLLFVSVIAHEMCHSLVALHYGIAVKGITLFMFGGAAHISREAPRPGIEMLIALAGPACSVLLGLLFLGAAFLVERFSVHVAVMMSWLFLMNMALGIFNLVPGFPPRRRPRAPRCHLGGVRQLRGRNTRCDDGGLCDFAAPDGPGWVHVHCGAQPNSGNVAGAGGDCSCGRRRS